MRKLIGPKEVTKSWTVDGVMYLAAGGEVRPTPPDNHMDHSLYGLGFFWQDDNIAEKSPLERGVFGKGEV